MIVLPEGNPSSSIAIIGEAPGAEEDRTGRPFVGASGQLLDGVLASSGWLRSKCYIDNVVTQRPERNDITPFIDCSGKNPVVSKDGQAYIDALKDRLQGVTSNLLLAVGTTAMYALTGHHNKVTKRRGSVYPCTLVPGKKVLVTVHPANVLREYDLLYPFMHDIRRAVEESTYPDIRTLDRSIKIAPTYAEAITYLESIQDGDTIGFDIEVVNREVSCFSIAKSPIDVISIALYTRGHSFFSLNEEILIWQRLASIMLNRKIKKVMHNAFFDSSFIFNRYGIVVNNIEDTMVGQAIIAPNLPKGLDFITSIYTKEPYYKDDGKQYFKLFTDEESFWRYNAKDSAVCLECYQPIMNDVRKMENEDVYQRHIRMIHPLIFMSQHGIKMDVAGLKKKSEDAEAQLSELQQQLNVLTGSPINISSPKQVQTYFYVTKGAKPYVSRSTGSITSDDEALTRLAIKGFKEADIILQMRKLSKANGTYYNIKLVDGRLKCSYNPVGAADTGRLSSSKSIFGDGGNMQNQPEDMKEMMLADDGYIICEFDLSQAENRIVAYISAESTMISAFEEGVDIHKKTASLILDKDISEVTPEERKHVGKPSNHGLNYDLGYRNFGLLHMIPETRAKFIVEKYHRSYPGVRLWHNTVKTKIKQDRILTNLMGRKRRFFGRLDDSLFKEGYAFIPQSTVADIINERGILSIWECPNYKEIILLNQVHDSIVFEIPYSDREHCYKQLLRIKEVLETPLLARGRQFIIPAELKIGKRLGFAKKCSLKSFDTFTKTLDEVLDATAQG